MVFVGRFRDRDGAGEGRDVYAVSLRGGGGEGGRRKYVPASLMKVLSKSGRGGGLVWAW